MAKKLYAAYGSNLNLRQMKYRCPTAKLYSVGVVEGYELQFKGDPNSAYATISPKDGASVPVALWEIQPEDERALDHYEGYPRHYFKKKISIQLADREVEAMAYIMRLDMEFGLPSAYYFRTVWEGYADCGLDINILNRAVKDSAQNFYSRIINHPEKALLEQSPTEWEETQPYGFEKMQL